MLSLNNVPTLDGYDPSTTIALETATTLELDIYNASALVKLRPFDETGRNNLLPYGPEFLLAPTADKTYENCAGAAIRSAVAGSPARISARLYEPGDASPAGGTPNPQFISPAGAVSSSNVVTGTVTPYAGTVAPTGFVLCDGTAYNAVSDPTFAALFGVIGNTFGGTDNTNFRVPDIRGRMVAGYAAGGHADVATLGNTDGVALGSRRPKHSHTVTDPGHTHPLPLGTTAGATFPQPSGTGNTQAVTSSAVTGVTVGVATAPVDSPGYLVLPYIIAK